jgi:pyruvate dehydrogenase E1 component beta subunit
MVPTSLRVAAKLAEESIGVEVIDLRTVAPLDRATVLRSVAKTKRLVVADPGWQSVGVAAEIIAFVCEQLGRDLEANPARVCFPDSHTPMSAPLEAKYYPGDDMLTASIRAVLQAQPVL